MGGTPYFEWYKTPKSQFRFRIKAANHEKLANSESYVRKIDMMKTMSLIDPSGTWPVKEVKR